MSSTPSRPWAESPSSSTSSLAAGSPTSFRTTSARRAVASSWSSRSAGWGSRWMTPYRISEAVLKPLCIQRGMPSLTYESDGYAVSPAVLRQVVVHIQQVLEHRA